MLEEALKRVVGEMSNGECFLCSSASGSLTTLTIDTNLFHIIAFYDIKYYQPSNWMLRISIVLAWEYQSISIIIVMYLCTQVCWMLP